MPTIEKSRTHAPTTAAVIQTTYCYWDWTITRTIATTMIPKIATLDGTTKAPWYSQTHL